MWREDWNWIVDEPIPTLKLIQFQVFNTRKIISKIFGTLDYFSVMVLCPFNIPKIAFFFGFDWFDKKKWSVTCDFREKLCKIKILLQW